MNKHYYEYADMDRAEEINTLEAKIRDLEINLFVQKESSLVLRERPLKQVVVVQ